MANKEESFISRNSDLINTTGHTINALQNLKVQENQKKIAKLQAVNLAVQKENYDLNTKKVELLEDQKKYFDDKKRLDEQNVYIKKLMLKTAPELEDLTESLQENSGNEDVLAKYLDARFMLRFIENNRGLIEDINFQRLINDQEKEINKLTPKIDNESKDLADNLIPILKEHIEYLKAINIQIQTSVDVQKLSPEAIKEAESTLFELFQDPIQASIIAETFTIIQEESIDIEELNFEDEFLKETIQICKNICSYNYYKENVIDQFNTAKEEINIQAKKELKRYLKSKVRNKDGLIFPQSPRFFDVTDDNFAGIDIEKISSLTNKIKSFTDEDFDYMEGSAFYLENYFLHLHKLIKWQKRSPKKKSEISNYIQKKTKLSAERSEVIKEILKKIKFIESKYPKDRPTARDSYDHNENSSSSGCFIITATTGSANNIIVNDFKRFRDEKLVKFWIGRTFISVYYMIAPVLATVIENNQSLRDLTLKYFVTPMHTFIKTYLFNIDDH